MNDKITPEKIIKELGKLPLREYQSANQRKLYSEIGVALLTTHLEMLIDERNWFTGIIMSASMLEFVGKTMLLWEQARASKTEICKIYLLNFAQTIGRLRASKIIDKHTYKRMEKIRHKRNDMAHELPIQVAVSLINKPNADLEALIKDAIEIINTLFSRHIDI